MRRPTRRKVVVTGTVEGQTLTVKPIALDPGGR